MADRRDDAVIDLYWIPLGAGTPVVRVCGRAYEALVARRARRPRQPLYHSALVARDEGGSTVVEVAPMPDWQGRDRRGAVVDGPVGSRRLGRFRVFRYEVRRWRNGEIPDLAAAVGDPIRITDDPVLVARVLDLVAAVPAPVWGRDEAGAGEMWNSNSVVSWVLRRAGVDHRAGAPPEGGRAPGWDAGLQVASGVAVLGGRASGRTTRVRNLTFASGRDLRRAGRSGRSASIPEEVGHEADSRSGSRRRMPPVAPVPGGARRWRRGGRGLHVRA